MNKIDMQEKVKLFFQEKITHFSWQRVGFILLAFFILVGIFFGSLVAYGYTFKERTMPDIYLGQLAVGKMDKVELKYFLEKITDKLVDQGWTFVYEKDNQPNSLKISPVLAMNGNSFELVNFDIEKEVERLFNAERGENLFETGWRAFSKLFRADSKLNWENIEFDKEKIRTILIERLSEEEIIPHDANVLIHSISSLDYEIIEPQIGSTYAYEKALTELINQWSNLNNPEIIIEKYTREPLIQPQDVESITGQLPKILTAGGLQLSYKDPETKREYSWQITIEQLADWIQVKKDNENKIYFGLNTELVSKFLLEKVAPQINVPARDAKFKMGENGKVVEFQGSRPGIQLNISDENSGVGTVNLLEKAWRERSLHESGFTKVVTVEVQRAEPNIKTGDVNDLGIDEILGVGVSSYAGSPTNRIKNIRLAVDKLNGLIIAPGEEFSAIKFLSPFTAEAGYLPELVIKGDEIKPEVGGGLCQIGTTLFRMAMNSAMKITARRNHSLVVSYYNDLSNGNPGTDATFYDPAPDFKFLNDTNNSILIQTEMDAVTQKLYFTIWGKNDGRKGYYSLPQVIRWIKPGAKKIIETTKLAPGVTSCQHAYTGADASFTYTRELNNNQKEETVFESHYRPLPEICLVGVAEPSVPETELENDSDNENENENSEETIILEG